MASVWDPAAVVKSLRSLIEQVESGQVQRVLVLCERADGQLEYDESGGLEMDDLRVAVMLYHGFQYGMGYDPTPRR